jgi:hypothetical protein
MFEQIAKHNSNTEFVVWQTRLVGNLKILILSVGICYFAIKFICHGL